MKRYLNLGGESSVRGYEGQPAGIAVTFADGWTYTWTATNVGIATIQQMHSLARAGQGLGSFINRRVRYWYSSKGGP